MIVEFSDKRALEVALVGGKGYGLAKATQAGLPVPSGIVLTTKAYREWFLPHRQAVLDLLAKYATFDEKSQAITQFLADKPLPSSVLDTLMAWQDKHKGKDFAVRSSGSAEDMPGAAFAGLHDTFLNVSGLDNLTKAVKQCWLSLWNSEVLPYRERLGVAHDEVHMAVVVQEMVNVRADEPAGVAFSIDPVRGDVEAVLINASFGLGETVVAGESPVDEYRVDKAGKVIMTAIADKPFALIKANEGNRNELFALGDAGKTSSLTDEQALAIANLARQAELYFGFPQDIEWAITDGKLSLLQSRPITRFAPKWTRDESAERFPNPITPLTWHLCEKGFHDSLNYSFNLMGLPPFYDKWFSLKDGYVYGNQNAVAVYAGRLPLEPLKDEASLAKFIDEGGLWQYAWVSDLQARWMNDLDSYLLALGKFNHIDYEHKSIGECWEILKEINALGTAYFLPNIAISLTQTLLYKVLRYILTKLVGDKAQTVFDHLVSVTETKTGAVNKAMWQLSRQLQKLGTLKDERFYDKPSLMTALAKYPDFLAQFEKFLALHGHREVDFDAYCPTWVEAPQTVFSQIQMMAGKDDDEHERQYWQKKDAMYQTELELLKNAPEHLRFFLQELIRLVRDYTALDDIEHYQTTRLTLPFRKCAFEIGKRLVNFGALDDAWDIFFVPPEPLEQAIVSHNFAGIRQIVAQEKAIYQSAKQTSPKWVYGESQTPTSDDGWQGLGGSSGVVEGEVFVITDPNQFADFPAGAILVARTTNPAWTPLFYHAKGVITESGGPLSHGAVTARELGIPAVMSIRDACHRLKNGQKVRLDGSLGRVVLL